MSFYDRMQSLINYEETSRVSIKPKTNNDLDIFRIYFIAAYFLFRYFHQIYPNRYFYSF